MGSQPFTFFCCQIRFSGTDLFRGLLITYYMIVVYPDFSFSNQNNSHKYRGSRGYFSKRDRGGRCTPILVGHIVSHSYMIVFRNQRIYDLEKSGHIDRSIGNPAFYPGRNPELLAIDSCLIKSGQYILEEQSIRTISPLYLRLLPYCFQSILSGQFSD